MALLGAVVLAIAVVGVTAASADTTPSVTIAAPSFVTYTSAQLAGTVNPNGGPTPTEWRFELSETGEEGSFNWVAGGEFSGSEAEATSPLPVSHELTGLKAGAFYYVRLVATNEFGGNRAVTNTTFSTEAIAAPTVSIAAPTAITAAGAHFSGQIEPGGADPAFDVAWHFECTPACPGLEGTIAADNSAHTVEADPTGLLPGTAYEVSLVAKNAGEAVSAGPEVFTTDPLAPQVLSTQASPLSDEATLSAQVNPGGLATTYRFEYGPGASYGQSTATKSLSASGLPATAGAIAFGLTPGATYHFRIVATNAEGTTEGPDRTFVTNAYSSADTCPNAGIRAGQGATQLGSCRAFEMVSPPEKNGANISIAAGQSSPDGNAVHFQSSGAFAGAEGAGHMDDYIARRGAGGWDVQAIAPFQTPFNLDAIAPMEARGYEMFTPDLSHGIFAGWHDPNERNSELDNDQRQLFLRDTSGKFTRLTPTVASPPLPISYPLDPVLVGASTDLSRVFFESSQHLTPDAPPVETREVYEWANGEVKVVGILPDDSIAPAGAFTSSLGGNSSSTEHKWSVSPDGSDVVFQSGDPAQIYMRSDASTTIPISLSQKTGSVGDSAATGARFLTGASPDGKGFSKLYFTSSTELTDDAFTGPAQEGSDLYEYDVASGELRDLTANEDPVNPDGARVNSQWLRTTADGSYLYFVASGALAPGSIGNTPQVYVLHDGEISYIAPMLHSTTPSLFVSADGKRALFFVKDEITDEKTGGFQQAYIYDQPSGTVDCISCRPGHIPVTGAYPEGFLNGYWHLSNAEPTNITPDGSRAFFQTAQGLDPRDTNGQQDVYEWENGAIRLVSSGQGAEGANFVDASASGDDVFIATGERLLPQDIDANVDIYDARVNSGFPLPPTPGVPCEGDACQSPPNPPNDATPASASFRGTGNQNQVQKKKKRQAQKRKQAKHRQAKQKKQGRHRDGQVTGKPATRRHG